jgi:hypothetical protein
MANPADASLPEQVLDHVRLTHTALDKANEELTKQAAARQEAAKLIPEVVEELVRHERISPADREKAAQVLADPVGLLQTLKKAADPGHTVRPKPLGAPGAAKEASAQASLTDPYVGRRTSEKKASDLAFERHFQR